jgi:hypothetical protein
MARAIARGSLITKGTGLFVVFVQQNFANFIQNMY